MADACGARESLLARTVQAQGLVREGHATEALELIEETLADARETSLVEMLSDALRVQAEALAALGRSKDAADALEEALDHYERAGVLVALEPTRRQLEAITGDSR